jgi:transcriptional regulator with XRE-family HTH domain
MTKATNPTTGGIWETATMPQRKKVLTNSSPTVEIGQQNFGRRLQQLLDQKGMNYSDLARKVWGKTTTRSGYEVAKNRDRISVYIAGKAFPDPRNLKKIADQLGVSVADLAPEQVGDRMIEQPNPTYSITKVQGGDTDKVFLRVNKVVPEAVAAKIMFLLATNCDVLIENAMGQTLVVEAKLNDPNTTNEPDKVVDRPRSGRTRP